ncbi:MAG: flippase [Burkholderiaceae bacterium]
MTTLRHVLSNSSWWLGEKVLVLGTTLATNVVLVRALKPAGFGELSYLLAITGLLVPLTQLGISGLVARAVLEKPDADRAILRAALLIRAAGCALALLGGAAYWAWFDPERDSRTVLLVLLAAQSATMFQLLEFWFQAQMNAGGLVPFRTAAILVAAGLKVLVAQLTRDASAVAAVFAVEYALLAGAYLVAHHRASGYWTAPGVEPEWLRWFAKRAPWLVASGLAEVVYLRIDVVMLERLRGVTEAGVYAVASKVSEVWYVIPVLLSASMFPMLWSRRQRGEGYERSLQAGLDALFAIAFTIALLTQWLSGPLIHALFGAAYDGAVPVLELHIWGGIFIFMRSMLSRWLLAEDLLRYSLLTHFTGAFVNVAANWLLIPRYGATGAAGATVLSYAVASWLALFLARATRPMAFMMTRALLLPFRWSALAHYFGHLRLALAKP